MQISLKSIIREAFNTAYKQYKNNNLIVKESTDRLALKMTPEEIQKADELVNTLVNRTPGWENIQWDPKNNNGLSKEGQSYIIEKLVELYKSTGDKKYKNAIGNFYSFASKGSKGQLQTTALYNSLFKKLTATTAMERLLQHDPDALYRLVSQAWSRYFAGGKVVPRTGENKGQAIDAWDRLMQQYSSTTSSFGALLLQTLYNEVRNETNKEADVVFKTTSTDAPSNVTGKSTDLEDTDGAEDPEQDDSGDEIVALDRGDMMYGDTNASGGTYDSDDEYREKGDSEQGYEDTDVNKKQQKQFEILKNWDNAIETITNGMKTIPKITDAEKAAFKGVMQDGLTYSEIASKYKNLFSGNKKIEMELNNKNLKDAANEVLKPYGLDYSIFNNPDWDEQFMGVGRIKEEEDKTVKPLNPYDIIEEIINLFYSKSKLGTTAKNKTANIFKQYALNHKTVDQIAASMGEDGSAQVKETLINLVKDPEKNTGFVNPTSPEEVNFTNAKPDLFYKLCVDTLLKFGFPRKVAYNAFIGYDFMAYAKLAKERQEAEQAAMTKSDALQTKTSKQAYENFEIDKDFIKENYNTIINMVYKRLSREL